MAELRCGKVHRVFAFKHIQQFSGVAGIKQLVNIGLFANPYFALLKHLDKLFVRFYKPCQRHLKGIKTAFQPFDKNAFHKTAHVLLGCYKFGIGLLVQQICYRFISGVSKIFNSINCFIKSFVNFFVKFINNFFRRTELWKRQFLLGKVVLIILFNFRARPANHNMAQYFGAYFFGIGAELLHIFF